VDLSARLGKKRTEITRRTCIVIIEVETNDKMHDADVVVDSDSEVLEIATSDIEPAPSFGVKTHANFIAGMGKVSGKFVIILSNNVLSPLEHAAIAEGSLLEAQQTTG